MGDFNGKNVVVTGASRGIGRAIALAFAAEGAHLVVASRKLEPLEKLCEEIRGQGGAAHAVAANLGKLDEVRNLAGRCREIFGGRVDALVNNAATNPVFTPLIAAEERTWDKIMDVNLKGPFFLTLELAADMIERKSGAVVNIASTAGIQGWLGLGMYGISKAGLMQMTRQMAREWAEAGLRVNAVAPGLVNTDFSRAIIDNEIFISEALKNVAMKRYASVDEITGLVLFLASDRASFITGQTYIVDGGSLC